MFLQREKFSHMNTFIWIFILEETLQSLISYVGLNPDIPLMPQMVFSACCQRVWSQSETSVIHFGLGLEFLSLLARQLELEIFCF